MEYDDELKPTPQMYAEMAKAYSATLKEQGFVFIRLSAEDYNFLVDEVFDLLFKLRSSYRFLKGFMESNRFFNLNEDQINNLRTMFKYTKNRAFQIRTNKTKCFINSIALENRLILKLNELAQKSDFYEEISLFISQRLSLTSEAYSIEGIFNSMSSLSFD